MQFWNWVIDPVYNIFLNYLNVIIKSIPSYFKYANLALNEYENDVSSGKTNVKHTIVKNEICSNLIYRTLSEALMPSLPNISLYLIT